MIVLDASAILAFLSGEEGADAVAARLDDSPRCSAANWSEVAQKLGRRGVSWPKARAALAAFGIKVEPVTQADSEFAAALWRAGDGLSLADRLCLALGERLGSDILTGDHAWEGRPGVIVIR